jgi:hypothetical protein
MCITDSHERHGVVGEATLERFMVSQPTFRITTPQTMEVTIIYA